MNRGLEYYRNIAAAFLQRGLDPAERESRGRELADAGVDLARGIQLASAVLPSRMTAKFNGEAAFRAALEQHQQFGELRALADFTGLNGRGVETGLGGTGYGNGLPLIREIATPGSTAGGHRPVIPEITAGPTSGVVDPALPLAEGTAITISDAGAAAEWHYGTIVALISRQVADAAKANEGTGALLDQLLADLADRAAELWIGDALRDAAGDTRDTDSMTALAIDEAEAAASAALDAPADLLLVNPANWPEVRRVVADSWQQAPAPTPAVSMGVPVGTMLVTGRAAFHLFNREPEHVSGVTPRNLSTEVGVGRPFYLAVRKPDAIQAVVLTEA